MSDGSATLTLRDPESFKLLGQVTVHDGDRPLTGLNELDCTGPVVWANILPTGDFARIDPGTGRGTAILRIGALPDLPPTFRRPGNVNGIAVDPASHELLITGKYWPHIYRIPSPARRMTQRSAKPAPQGRSARTNAQRIDRSPPRGCPCGTAGIHH